MMSVQLPASIPSGLWNYGHCQGIAIDTQREYMYFSFTTVLIKTDLAGNVIGSVTGLLGHLGCIDFNDEDGRVYGSLEYKNDPIGQGILKHAGVSRTLQTAFYIVAFDVEKISRMEMDACTDGVMTSVYLREVVEDYSARVQNEGRTVEHRHGCSGIDGITFGCIPGTATRRLFVANGVYGDNSRTDNDYQVILCYDTADWKQYEQPLSQQNMHESGPEKPEHKFFVYTGNTTWGVQNLEYDEKTSHLLMAVYCGKKECFPNYNLYIIDGSKAPCQNVLRGVEPEMNGGMLTLLDNGTGAETPGWRFPHGSTGICSLGDGRFYVSLHGKENGLHYTNVQLFSWNEIIAQ